MTYVMQMSTDQDIINTQLNAAWNPITARYSWLQVSGMNLGIPAGATIVVIAHGDANEIGNAQPGTVDIDASTFLALIQGNMAQGAVPAAIYISTCGPGIPQFAAAVRMAAQQNRIWANNTRIFGHSDPISCPVPAPNSQAWFEIF
ncbi:hypothetical protein NR798_06835 [Archangium gephyra]|uniref:hypothetical protein n=1 Tax=Archangium gephyra TaxID=48 RepID=UPI0035D50149